MRYRNINRKNRLNFSMAQIGEMIELAVFFGHSFRAISKAYGCSDKTVGYYVNRHYYGKTKGKTVVLTLKSKMIDMEGAIAA